MHLLFGNYISIITWNKLRHVCLVETDENTLTHQETVVVVPGRVQLLSSGFRICGLISSVVFTLMTGRALITQQAGIISLPIQTGSLYCKIVDNHRKTIENTNLVLHDHFSVVFDSLTLWI